MKRGDEELNASSLQFLRSVKRFIASILYSVLIASSPLLLKKNCHLMLHCCNFFKQIHHLKGLSSKICLAEGGIIR
jgi:hypothetical protein